MRKIESFYLAFATFLCLIGAPLKSQSVMDIFPYECENASDREALPGHVLRVGFVASTSSYGWSFFFPDQRISESLQMVPVAENVGLIGIGEANLSELQLRTPPGSFVVGQLFVGDQNAEPVVTCLSRPILLTRYVPKYYGFANLWLDRGTFGTWLKYRKFSKWKWRDRWHRDIYSIRTKFSEYRSKHRDRYERRDRDRKWRDRSDWRNRQDSRDWRDGDEDRDRVRDRVRDRRDRSNDGWRRGADEAEQATIALPSREVKKPIKVRRPAINRKRNESVESTAAIVPAKRVIKHRRAAQKSQKQIEAAKPADAAAALNKFKQRRQERKQASAADDVDDRD